MPAGSRSFTLDEAPRRQRRVPGEQDRMEHNRITRGSRIVQTQPRLDSQNPRLAHERMDAKHTRPTAPVMVLPRVTATVRYWNADRAFGFLRTVDGQDVFYHQRESALDPAVYVIGLRVTCSVKPPFGNQSKPSAVNLEIVEGETR